MSSDRPLIYLIAGEPSGDALGANLMVALTRRSRGAARFAGGNFTAATELFMRMVKAPALDEFLTLPAYERLP